MAQINLHFLNSNHTIICCCGILGSSYLYTSAGFKLSIVITYLCKEVDPQCASLARRNNQLTTYYQMCQLLIKNTTIPCS